MAKNLIFGSLDHSKMLFSDFGMIQHERYHWQTVKDIYYYQNMQYQVDPVDQTRENGQQLDGSFKPARTRIPVSQ